VAKRKKSRTPAPPKRTGARPAAPSGDGQARQVQAPKVRTGKRRTQAEQERRSRLILYGLALSGIVGLVIALVVVFAFRGGGGGGPSTAHDDGPNVDFAKLIGIRTDKPPWSPGYTGLDSRLKPLGLSPLATEGEVLHIHEHLDIFDNGKHVKVPALIGIPVTKDKTKAKYFVQLHTHDDTGIIHLESTEAHSYSLGQFFGVWGVFLSKKCVGGLCGPIKQPLKFYIDGKRFLGNPVRLVLENHQEIAIVYGTPPSHIPSSFDFAANGL